MITQRSTPRRRRSTESRVNREPGVVGGGSVDRRSCCSVVDIRPPPPEVLNRRRYKRIRMARIARKHERLRGGGTDVTASRQVVEHPDTRRPRCRRRRR